MDKKEPPETPVTCYTPRYTGATQKELIRQLKQEARQAQRANPHTESAKLYFEHMGEELDVENNGEDDDEPEQDLSGLNDQDMLDALQIVAEDDEQPLSESDSVLDLDSASQTDGLVGDDLEDEYQDVEVELPSLDTVELPAERGYSFSTLEELTVPQRLQKIAQAYQELKLRSTPLVYTDPTTHSTHVICPQTSTPTNH